MPKGDHTGPQGAGPKTGRAAGPCAGNPIPGYQNPRPDRNGGSGGGGQQGRGKGRGRKGGQGRGQGRNNTGNE
jgi:hypothetical protein